MLNVGIYKIENIRTGKTYIGSTNSFERRKNQHFKELRTGRHVNESLQNDFYKYGEGNFKFSILEYTWRNTRLEREQYWIDYYRKKGLSYNGMNSQKIKKENRWKKFFDAVILAFKENFL